tara:strand:+ start:774 stop:2738 length:1965 start_codon:yes stop_codon:yes gene_type:complete
MSQIQVDNIYNKEATGSPNFPLGANVTGVVTATTFKGGAEITSGTISATSVTAASGTFNGPVTIGGTLTYEDVTNIDSVGVITARNGIKVNAGGIDIDGGGIDITGNIGLGGATYGAAGEVLTSGGSGANATWTAISAAPEISSNAASGISAGSAVSINSSGQIAGITSSTIGKTPNSDGSGLFTSNSETGDGNTTISSNSASNKYRHLAYDPDNNIMIAQFKANNNAIVIRAYKLASDGTWATSSGGYELSNQDYTFSSICYAGQGRFVSAYRDTSGNMRCRVLTVNTTTYEITVGGQEYVSGSAFTIQNDTSQRYQTRCIWHPPTNKIIFAYCQSGQTYYRATYGTMNYSSNIVDTWGSDYLMWGSTETFIINDSPAFAYDPDTQKIIFYAFYNGSTASVSAIAITINASSITMGTRYEVQQGSGMASNNMSVGYDTLRNKAVFSWKNNSNNWHMRIANVASNGTMTTVDGDTIVTGQSAGHCQYATMTCVGNGLVAFIWSDNQFGNMHMKIGEIRSNNTMHIGSSPEAKVIASGTFEPRSAVYNSAVKRVTVFYYYSGGALSNLQSAAVSTVNSNSNGYVGIANTTVTSGQSLVVRTFGGTTSTLSGLSTGSTYYVQSNGTFSTTADADVAANPSVVGGVALNGTTMLVKS